MCERQLFQNLFTSGSKPDKNLPPILFGWQARGELFLDEPVNQSHRAMMTEL